jgi:hypothetical protein
VSMVIAVSVESSPFLSRTPIIVPIHC